MRVKKIAAALICAALVSGMTGMTALAVVESKISSVTLVVEADLEVGQNIQDIGWQIDKRTGRIIVMSVLDNLVKGAAGQAVQNMNVMFGIPENTGLTQLPIYP